MSFKTTGDIDKALKSRAICVSELYQAWEKRVPLGSAPTRGKGAAQAAETPIVRLKDDLTEACRFITLALERKNSSSCATLPGGDDVERTEHVSIRLRRTEKP